MLTIMVAAVFLLLSMMMLTVACASSCCHLHHPPSFYPCSNTSAVAAFVADNFLPEDHAWSSCVQQVTCDHNT